MAEDEKGIRLYSEIEEPTSSKNKIIIISVVVGAFLLVIIAVILFIVLLHEDSEDEKGKDEKPKPIIFNSTSGNHTHTIIFMPGFASTPENFVKTFEKKINFTKKNDTTIIILRSPLVDVTVVHSKNYSWFDIYNFPITNYSCFNLEQLKESAKILEEVINSEVNILNGKYDKIIIGGHSQGAFISLYQAYNSQINYGGLFAFSGILPPGEINNESKANLPAFFAYGDKDNIIEPSFMLESLERIQDFPGLIIKVYENHTHYVSTKEATDAAEFLDNLIK